MANKMPDETQAAIDHLLRAVRKDGVLIAGFAFCVDPPVMINFSNDPSLATNIAFYKMACESSEKKIKEGNVIRQHVGEVA